MGAWIASKWTRLTPRVLRHQPAQVMHLLLPYDLFFRRRERLSILRACSYIFYLICAFGSHVTWNSAVPDPDVWCWIFLFLCTLASGRVWSVCLLNVMATGKESVHGVMYWPCCVAQLSLPVEKSSTYSSRRSSCSENSSLGSVERLLLLRNLKKDVWTCYTSWRGFQFFLSWLQCSISWNSQ